MSKETMKHCDPTSGRRTGSQNIRNTWEVVSKEMLRRNIWDYI